MSKLYGPDPLPMTVAEAEALQKLCLSLPRNPVIIQIGAYIGASTVAMMQARNDAFIFSIDIKPHHEEQQSISERGLKGQCLRVLGDSVEIGQFWPIAADMVFIDGDHRYEAVVKDIDTWQDKVKRSGILVFHDYIPNPQPPIKGNVARAVDEKIHKHALVKVERLIAFRM